MNRAESGCVSLCFCHNTLGFNAALKFRAAHHRAPLRLMGVHPLEDSVEEPDGLDDIGPFVQHHTFGAPTHHGVGNLGARWSAF